MRSRWGDPGGRVCKTSPNGATREVVLKVLKTPQGHVMALFGMKVTLCFLKRGTCCLVPSDSYLFLKGTPLWKDYPRRETFLELVRTTNRLFFG